MTALRCEVSTKHIQSRKFNQLDTSKVKLTGKIDKNDKDPEAMAAVAATAATRATLPDQQAGSAVGNDANPEDDGMSPEERAKAAMDKAAEKERRKEEARQRAAAALARRNKYLNGVAHLKNSLNGCIAQTLADETKARSRTPSARNTAIYSRTASRKSTTTGNRWRGAAGQAEPTAH